MDEYKLYINYIYIHEIFMEFIYTHITYIYIYEIIYIPISTHINAWI